MGGNGNGNDSMGVGKAWEQESNSRTPLPTVGYVSRGMVIGTSPNIIFDRQRGQQTWMDNIIHNFVIRPIVNAIIR